MILPQREKAYVPPEKLLKYLLSETHSVGQYKAHFFRSFGFDESNFDLLSASFIELAQTNDVDEIESSSHGTKYVITGMLRIPSGTDVKIKTIWIIEPNNEAPRFVTAYPA
ncbi:MAG: hypothetical protein IH899_11175 [Planctomycetes bacterium]|nr:hypothetical protein [Planctomycetota bacterium]